tara:strand:- start:41 stop:829 length:789 start_codon:yes stop_codon:yes gene_type:complete
MSNEKPLRELDRFLGEGVNFTDDPKQLRLKLEQDYFVYVARMNSDVTSYVDGVWTDEERLRQRDGERKSLTAIKIGYSRDPVKRVKNLASGPYSCDLIMHSYPMNEETARKTEKEFHESLEAYRMKEREKQREWFALPAKELYWIKKRFEKYIDETTGYFLNVKHIHDLNFQTINELPAKGGGTIKQKNLGVEPFTYHPFKIFLQGSFESPDDIYTYNWGHIVLNKQTREQHPGNKDYDERYIKVPKGWKWPGAPLERKATT